MGLAVNDVSLEIKRRITLANRCYYGLNGQLSSRDLSRTTKLILYKTVILPMLLYGAEGWMLLNNDVAALRVFERKVQSMAMISAVDTTVSCMSPSTTWTFCSVLISSGCDGAAMSFVWWRMLRRDEYLMREYVEVVEKDVGRTKSRKPYHRLVWPHGIGAQEADAPGSMCCGRPKPVKQIVMTN